MLSPINHQTMKRIFKISDAAASHSELLTLHRSKLKPLAPTTTPSILTLINAASIHSFASHISAASTAHSTPTTTNLYPSFAGLFLGRYPIRDVKEREYLTKTVSCLREELIESCEDSDIIYDVLEEKGEPLFREYGDGSAFVELLAQLRSTPQLALQVLNWRRKLAVICLFPMTPEEYSKGIKFAGSAKCVDLAIEMFHEASSKNVKSTCIYNALMTAYMCNGFAEKCLSVFEDMKKDANCPPSVISYNIIISLLGRLVLVDHMEAAFKEMKDSNVSPDVTTYNNLIAGYVTAWMWDSMEKVFLSMKEGIVQPNLSTYLLMLRGYAHSGNLEQMEETYALVKDHINENELPLIRAMICAYCKSSLADRVKKVESLLRLIPEQQYRPWLNVLLIKLYAQEDRLERMENSLGEAFEHNTSITTSRVMRAIIACYFRCNAVDRLADFVKRAECARWRICRSLYHCKLVMYGMQNRLEEMENVLIEMDNINFVRTKKTLTILYIAYLNCGQSYKVEQVCGLMFKRGYVIPFEAPPS